MALWALLLPAVGKAQTGSNDVLHVAWSLQAPYQFLKHVGDRRDLTGIDVVTFEEAARNAGFTVVFHQMPWQEALDSVASGEVDVVLAAFQTPDRREFSRFSAPLRYSQESLFLPTGRHSDAQNLEQLLEAIERSGTKLAVVGDYELGGTFSRFIRKMANSDLVVETRDLDESLDLVESGRVDGFVMDRLVGNQALALRGLTDLAAHPIPVYEAEINALFSRASVSEETVARFDGGLKKLREEGRLDTIQRRFVLPAMIQMALSGEWFQGILLTGMIAFSISAVVIARTGNYGLFGALVLASLPALGGGIVRDLLILREPYIFTEALYVYIVLGTLALAYLFNRLLDQVRGRSLIYFDLVNWLLLVRRRVRPQLLMEIFDAAGIAAFTVVAVTIAVEFGADPLWLWGPVLAALTATGGAILRDMIRRDVDNAILHGAFYGETVIIWSLLLCFYLQYLGQSSDPTTIFWALMATMAGIFATRMAFVAFGWRAPRY